MLTLEGTLWTVVLVGLHGRQGMGKGEATVSELFSDQALGLIVQKLQITVQKQ